MFPESLLQQSTALIQQCSARGLRITTAESCTGGLLSGLLTSVPGASEIFYVGFVSYSNIAKIHQLNVPESLLEQHGAVSEQVATAMAEGALTKAHAHIALSITGVAGPGGGSDEKPVGLVYVACANANGTLCSRNIFTGDRQEIRFQACAKAIEMANSSLRA